MHLEKAKAIMQNHWNVEVVVIEAKNLTDLRLLFALLLLVFVTSLGTPLMLAQTSGGIITGTCCSTTRP
jgi:hypothetical protein